MRVITGSAKGHGLKAPRHPGLRPTPSRVKEAVFSSLAARIPSARILELFAGTGAFSIEALSRGAAAATLVEKDPRAVRLIEANLRKTNLEERARLLRLDVRVAVEYLGRADARFDLIFADPPYSKGRPPRGTEERPERIQRPCDRTDFRESSSWLEFLLHSEMVARLLDAEGLLLIEHFKKEIPSESAHFIPRQAERHRFCFGDTVVSLFSARKIG